MKGAYNLCSIPECGREKGTSRGLCNTHYRRWLRHGDPLGGGTYMGDAEEFLEKAVNYTGASCLIWPFSKLKGGYGRLRVNGRMEYAHREVCRRAHGEPPTDKHHAAHDYNGIQCESEACVNPGHLRWASASENAEDRIAHGNDTRGEKGGTAKLRESDVREIIQLRGIKPQRKIAEMYSISPSHVGRIHLGEAWPHISMMRGNALSQGAVRVRPLEWEHHRWRHETNTPFGSETIYEIRFEGNSGKVAYAIWGEVEYQSVDAAKAAAQADYERRILSALCPAPVGVRAKMNPMETAPFEHEDYDEASQNIFVHKGSWAIVHGTNGKAAGWVDTHGLFAHFLYRDQIITDTQEGLSERCHSCRGEKSSFLNGVCGRCDGTGLEPSRQSALTACQQEVEKADANAMAWGAELKSAKARILELEADLEVANDKLRKMVKALASVTHQLRGWQPEEVALDSDLMEDAPAIERALRVLGRAER